MVYIYTRVGVCVRRSEKGVGYPFALLFIFEVGLLLVAGARLTAWLSDPSVSAMPPPSTGVMAVC